MQIKTFNILEENKGKKLNEGFLKSATQGERLIELIILKWKDPMNINEKPSHKLGNNICNASNRQGTYIKNMLKP